MTPLDNRIPRLPAWFASEIRKERFRYLNRLQATWFYKGSPAPVAALSHWQLGERNDRVPPQMRMALAIVGRRSARRRREREAEEATLREIREGR